MLDWTTEELEAEEARLSADIQELDEQITALRNRQRDIAVEVEPYRKALETRRRERANNDPRTQGVGG